MTHSTPQPIASGLVYLIAEVDGRRPEKIDDFVGEVAFTAVRDEESCRIEGSGRRAGDLVRFHQKGGPTGRDLRVWEVTVNSDNDFQAQSTGGHASSIG